MDRRGQPRDRPPTRSSSSASTAACSPATSRSTAWSRPFDTIYSTASRPITARPVPAGDRRALFHDNAVRLYRLRRGAEPGGSIPATSGAPMDVTSLAFEPITGLPRGSARHAQPGRPDRGAARAHRALSTAPPRLHRGHPRAGARPRRARPRARCAAARTCGPLHGIPYAAKDLYDVRACATTAGTRLLAGNVAREDCAAVRRLAAAGMVLLGKTLHGAVRLRRRRHQPRPRHAAQPVAPVPARPRRLVAAARRVAVAAGLVPMALGTDTGGSVRHPRRALRHRGAQDHGRARQPRRRLPAELDARHASGPLTRSVEDAALVYQALQGADSADETTVGVAAHDALARPQGAA